MCNIPLFGREAWRRHQTSKIPTGIKGLDEMLAGGFPKGRVILLCGGPGTGKTILVLQFLATVAKRGVPCVYLTLEEPLRLIRQNIKAFAWNIEKEEKSKHLTLLESYITSYGDIYKQKNRNVDKSILSITSEVTDAVKSIGAELLVIDPLTSITISEQSAGVKRRKIAEFFNFLRKDNLTSILTSETTSHEGEFYMEEFLSDGVIRLDKAIRNFNLVRTIRIEKMRSAKHDEQPRRYIIGEKGISIYNTEPIKI